MSQSVFRINQGERQEVYRETEATRFLPFAFFFMMLRLNEGTNYAYALSTRDLSL